MLSGPQMWLAGTCSRVLIYINSTGTFGLCSWHPIHFYYYMFCFKAISHIIQSWKFPPREIIPPKKP